MLAAPIHPADVTTIEGRYGLRPGFPAVGGMEGCGVVERVGLGVQGVRAGDIVVAAGPGFGGTWRQMAVVKAKDVIVVNGEEAKEANAAAISMAAVNPVTAKLLLGLADLKAGDVVLQNAGCSAVGLFVSQLAAQRGIKTINILRRGPNYEEQCARAQGLGQAFLVAGDDYFRSPSYASLVKDLPAPRLALDAVGGDATKELARHLAPGGTLVSYGAMAHPAVTVPVSSLIFKDITIKGFWLLNHAIRNPEAYAKDVREAAAQITLKPATDAKDGPLRLRTWAETRSFDKFWIDAWAAHKDPKNNRKVVLRFDQ